MVKFTELEFDERDLTHPMRLVQHSWPVEWTRIEVPLPTDHRYDGEEIITEWIEKNLSGRWGYLERKCRGQNDGTFIFAFEFENDALMFKLLGGHEAWDEDNG